MQPTPIPTRWPILAAIGAICTIGCRAPSPPSGDIVADLTLPVLDTRNPTARPRPFDPSPLRGKKLLVNFWRPG